MRGTRRWTFPGMRSVATLLAALGTLAGMCAGVSLALGTGTAALAHDDPLPLELGFEKGKGGSIPGGWIVPTKGWKAEIVEGGAVGEKSVRLFVPDVSDASFGNLMRIVDATPYRGRHVKLTAKIRLDEKQNQGQAQMWLRVDRPNETMGAFDNMGNRPIKSTTWKDATIELDVEDDAQQLALGFMSVGGTAAIYIDAVSLVVSGEAKPALPKQPASEPKALSERGTQNLVAAARLLSYVRFFHPSDQAAGVKAWDHFAVNVMERAEPAKDAKELAEQLRLAFEPVAPTLQVWSGGVEQAPALPPAPEGAKKIAQWRHLGAGTVGTIKGNIYQSRVELIDREEKGAPAGEEYADSFVIKDLGGGVSARLAIRAFADADGALPHGKTPERWTATDGGLTLVAENRSTRLAGVATAWGIFQHFYPYFDVIKTDWDAALAPALRKAAEDKTPFDYLYTLRELVAQLHDGHGNVTNMGIRAKSILPLALEWIGHDLVVVGKHPTVSNDVRVGDVIVSIDGKASEDVYKDVSKWISAATDGWARYVSTRAITVNYATNDPVELNIRHPDASTSSVRLARVNEHTEGQSIPKRPDQGKEIAPGIAFFDLNGASNESLEEALPALAAAKGVIFDLRGYPGQAGYELMQHLIDEPATSARWNVPIVRRPDREGWEWSSFGRWTLVPKAPRLTGQIAFLTDGRAISYAESVMGIVEAYKFGEIVGSTTAGTNGNVNPFALPGGYTITWTGMKVLKHDASQHHGIGIAPTVPITPTPKGVAEGKDEVLAKAIEVLTKKIAESDAKK